MTFFLEALLAKSQYVNDLPNWVQYWMQFMQIVFGSAILFVWQYKEARWILTATVISLIAALIWGGIFGFGPMWGMWHILFYTPALIYCYRKRGSIEFKSVYGLWVTLACATMMVSLAFDIFDVGKTIVYG